MFMAGIGSKSHLFTAGSQDVNNRFVASQLLYGNPIALPVPDVLRTDLLVVIGANPVVSQGSVLTAPRIRDRMHDIVKRGGRVLVIDPRKTETAAQFEWLPIVPDGDAFLLLSLLQVMFDENLADRVGIGRLAAGVDWLEQLATPFTPEATQQHTGVAPDVVRTLASDLVRTPRAAVYGRVGTSTGENGTLTTYLLDAVNLVAGNLDVAGGSMFGTWGLPAERRLNAVGSGAARDLPSPPVADRQLPVGADVGTRKRDGQGDHHRRARPDQGPGGQRGQSGAVGAQRHGTGTGAADARPDGGHRPVRQRDHRALRLRAACRHHVRARRLRAGVPDPATRWRLTGVPVRVEPAAKAARTPA
jgi:anaerobic selenocysteine-containing dehydrogenase